MTLEQVRVLYPRQIQSIQSRLGKTCDNGHSLADAYINVNGSGETVRIKCRTCTIERVKASRARVARDTR